ncbi:hypothetical protein [Pedobacter sp.]|uniref:hypothetical protein n=1 Tax=Pedobacter sp. TaxID=1411316 RepID=UPI0031E3C798
MKKIIALLLCLLGSSSLWAQENTVLGTGALSSSIEPKYTIKEINIITQGSYSRPTIDFGSYQGTWDYLYMWVGDNGLSIDGLFRSSVDLNGFMPSIIGGHGSGATLQLYFFAIDNDGKYLYEVYSDQSGSGYAPATTLSPMTSSTNVYIQSYIDENNQLNIYYSDNYKRNVYGTPPTVNVSFGGATALAILDGTVVNGQNTAIGYQALYSNADGRENTALGHQVLKNATGNSNIGIGYLAGNTITTGDNNLFIGNSAGNGITTGSGNVVIGRQYNSLNATLNNSILMADGSGNSRFFIGNNGNMKLGYWNDFTENMFKLDVNGAIRGATFMQTPRIYAKDLGIVHPQSTFYLDFMLTAFDTNTLDMRAIVNPNDFRRVFIIDKPSASVTFYTPVKGVNAINNNEFTTLGQVLDLNNAANNSVKINPDGNVGIGTTVVDNIQGWNKVLQVHGNQHAKLLVTESSGIKVGMFAHTSYAGKIGTESQHDLILTAGYWNDVMTLRTDGNVGIGTLIPKEKLSVNGKIRAREVKVEPTANWPDYVFEESYKPMSLAEISTFVKQHKHLPEVPSAKEVAQNGLELGEMNKLLLKKIEELTLHLIEKDKQLTETNQKVDKLAEQLEKLINQKSNEK